MNFPKVAVVILNWNGVKYLKKFLPSVMASTYPNLEIILGDNASTDQSVTFVKENFPSIRIVKNEKNFGFAGGYNLVLKQVEAEYFVLLNSDVEVSSGWIEPVIEMMQGDEQIAAAQPKILSFQNKDTFEYAGAAGGFIDHFGYVFCRGRLFDSLEKDLGQYNNPSQIFWASGASFFIRSSIWKDSGGLDADFFAHMEEIDLCWRLKNRGYKIMYCPESEVYHVGGGTLSVESSFKTYLNFRNNLVMLQKNLPGNKALLIIFIRFWLDLLSLIKFLMQGNAKNAFAVTKAHVYFISNYSKNQRKKAVSSAQSNKLGIYQKSIVWQFFGKGVKKFSELKF